MTHLDVPSPCVGVCRLDEAKRLCEGCLRTVREIARWPYANDEERRAVVASLPERRRALEDKGRRGPHGG